MNRRQPLGEIENADQTWKTVLSRFPHFKELVPNASQLGISLAAKAENLDNFIGSNLLTMVHGDCKGWNIFFKKQNCSNPELSPVLFIDLQWTGIGHPLQDVAYSLTTTLEPELLNSMDYYVDVYLKHLSNLISGFNSEKMKQHFDIVWLDYARVIVTGLWKRDRLILR